VQYAANATVAMPKPGKLPLNLLNREKGPLYRHASLIAPSQQHAFLQIPYQGEIAQLTLAPMDRSEACQLMLQMLLDRSL
jgi:hypothetical protein